MTERLGKAAKIMDIPMLDHIIIGTGGERRYISLKEESIVC